MNELNISALVGLTLAKVEMLDNDAIVFHVTDGRRFQLYHSQHCCEKVTVDDICGDLNDLVASPITQAEESTNSTSHPEGRTFDPPPDSFTWTFYRVATAKGQVVIRWFGESNGFYSESVDFAEVP